MWRHALLGAALCATLTKGSYHGYARQEGNSSTLDSSSSASLDATPSPIIITLLSDTSTASSSLTQSNSVTITSSSTSESTSESLTSSSLLSSTSLQSSTSESSTSQSSTSSISQSSTSETSTSLSSTSESSTSQSSTSASSTSQSSTSESSTSIISTSSTSLNSSSTALGPVNSTSLISANGTTPAPVICTGCVLQAFDPITTWFEDEKEALWVNVTVTETIITSWTTYMLDSTQIDTSVSNLYTVNQTRTFIGTDNKTITHTAKVFRWSIAPGTILTMQSGPTYVAYTNIWGGPDYHYPVETEALTTTEAVVTILSLVPPEPSCTPDPLPLTLGYQDIMPTRTEDWYSFIQTYIDDVPSGEAPETASLPPQLIQYLDSKPDIQDIFEGYELAECTQAPIRSVTATFVGSSEDPMEHPPPTDAASTPPPQFTQLTQSFQHPPAPSKTTETFLETSYAHTEDYTTVSGPLRRSKEEERPEVKTPLPAPQPNPEPSDGPNKRPGPSDKPEPPSPGPSDKPEEISRPADKPEDKKPGPTDVAGIIASLINDPNFTPDPNSNPTPGPQKPGQSITVGDSVLPIHPAQPSDPTKPNDPERENPAIVIGTDTLTPGQVTTINGVEVSVPPTGPNGERPSIVVGGSTIGVNPNPTGPPVLTVGDKVVTADPQGQFIVGTDTLTPGGPAITVDGSTLSLGPSGTIAIVNGVTQTLGFAPAPTGAPVLTVDGKEILATVIGGSTVFALGPGKTLTPGGVMTVDGTTFSMPADGEGSTVVVNGVTSTLNSPALPAITLNSQAITATVRDGTTEFVLGPSQTLTPGGVVTVDGTTFSLPADGSGTKIIVNGVTSTLSSGGLPVITLNSQSITATVQGGTTAFILGPSATLTPGGILTISGTTLSMPASASGSVIVINGVTSTLGESPITSAAALTINGKTYSATVRDGTTEYVLGPGTTLKPGESITVSGTTYSLDEKGTALVINGKTSTMPKTPASNSATTTRSGSKSASTGTSASSKSSGSSSSSRSSSASSSERDPGNFIASGIGITSEGRAYSDRVVGLDKWVEGVVIGVAGWVLMWL